MLETADLFSYEQIMLAPKEERSNIFNGVLYYILHNNGWLRLMTDQGRAYHILQAEHHYLLPDWKLHFSIAEEDMPKAWDIVADVFMHLNCNTTMKMKVADYGVNVWNEKMFGREITVYIYRHKHFYNDHPNFLFTHEFQKPRELWLDFIASAEKELAKNNIHSRGTADGDYSLGAYVSLRNEAYIPLKPEWKDIVPTEQTIKFVGKTYCYPPNIAGYNAAGNLNPLLSRTGRFFQWRPQVKQRHEIRNSLRQQTK